MTLILWNIPCYMKCLGFKKTCGLHQLRRVLGLPLSQYFPRRLLDVSVCWLQHRNVSNPPERCAGESYKHADLRKRSVCKWTYKVDYDERRRPSCIHRVDECHYTEAHESMNQCEIVNISYPIRLMSETSSTWTDAWIDLPVTCTLAKPPINEVPYEPGASGLPFQMH